jgi:hypothetical protein
MLMQNNDAGDMLLDLDVQKIPKELVATGVLNFGKEIIRDFLCSSFRAS